MIVPSLGGVNPMMLLMVVVLPAPFLQKIPGISPLRTKTGHSGIHRTGLKSLAL